MELTTSVSTIMRFEEPSGPALVFTGASDELERLRVGVGGFSAVARLDSASLLPGSLARLKDVPGSAEDATCSSVLFVCCTLSESSNPFTVSDGDEE